MKIFVSGIQSVQEVRSVSLGSVKDRMNKNRGPQTLTSPLIENSFPGTWLCLFVYLFTYGSFHVTDRAE